MKESDKNQKNKFRAFVRGAGSWIGAVAIGLAVTSLFVLIYNYTGTHIKNDTGATDYKWEANQYQATMVEGNARIQMDKYGFNNLSGPENTDILLMGASHMEAAMIAQNRNTGYLLDSKLDGLHTYNIGMSGHELMTCLNNLEAAIETYHPSKYIVIQSGALSFDDNSLAKALDGEFDEIPSYDSGVVYWLQKVPAVKVSFKQVEDKLKQDISSMNFFIPKQKNSALDVASEETKQASFPWDDELLLRLFKEKSELCRKHGIKLVLAYTPGVSADAKKNELVRNDLNGISEYMQSACDASGIVYVDLFEDFQKAYKSDCIFPFGFDNTKPFAGHLNEDGHSMLAERLAATITELEENK